MPLCSLAAATSTLLVAPRPGGAWRL